MKIFILVIVLFILLININKKEFFFSKTQSKKKKNLLILYGGSFRESRIDKHSESQVIKNQIKASKSHLTFINTIKEKYNIDTDIVIATYNNPNFNIMKKLYASHLINTNLNNISDNLDIGGLMCQIYDKIYNIRNNYDSIIFIRIDLVLKKYFFNIFKEQYHKITYTNWVYGPKCWRTFKPIWYVSPNITILPKKYYAYIEKFFMGFGNYRYGIPKIKNKKLKKWIEYMGRESKTGDAVHNQVTRLIQNTDLKKTDFDVLIHTIHSSNSSHDWNPLWYQPDRTISHKLLCDVISGLSDGEKYLSYGDKEIYVSNAPKYDIVDT